MNKIIEKIINKKTNLNNFILVEPSKNKKVNRFIATDLSSLVVVQSDLFGKYWSKSQYLRYPELDGFNIADFHVKLKEEWRNVIKLKVSESVYKLNLKKEKGVKKKDKIKYVSIIPFCNVCIDVFYFNLLIGENWTVMLNKPVPQKLTFINEDKNILFVVCPFRHEFVQSIENDPSFLKQNHLASNVEAKEVRNFLDAYHVLVE
jgi:hypothetical protein